MTQTDENLIARFVKRSASFGSLLLGVKVLNFLFLFVYWHLVDPADFGIIAVAQAVTVVLAPGLNFGLGNTVSRLFKEYTNRGEGGTLVGSTFLVSVLGALIICAVLTFFGAPLFRFLFPSVAFWPYLAISIWSAFFLSLCLFGEQVVRVTDRLKINAVLVTGEMVVKNALVLTLVLTLSDRAFAFLAGELGAMAVLGLAYTVASLRGASYRLRWSFLKDPVKLALPIIPAGVFSQFNNTLDRFVLVRYIPKAQLGVYSQAVKLNTVLDILSRALKTVWFPTLLRTDAGDVQNETLLKRSYLFIFDFLALAGLGIGLAGVPFIRLVAPEKYHDMCLYLPAVAFVFVIKNLVFLPSLRLLTTRFAVATLISTAFTAAAALGMHLIFTVNYGVVGAVVALGLTQVLAYGVAEGLARVACPAALPWGRIALRALIYAGLTTIATLLALWDGGVATMLVQAGLLAGVMGVMVAVYSRHRSMFLTRRISS